MDPSRKPFVIVGGGIAGVSCAEQLSQLLPSEPTVLLSSSPLIKAVTNFKQVSRSLEEFEVKEKSSAALTQTCPNVKVCSLPCTSFHPQTKVLKLADSSCLTYRKLCICTGVRPKVIVKNHPKVIGIRDTESVEDFQKKLSGARRIVVVGNGGIAIEVVYEVQGCEVVWAIKDKSIGQTFFDEGAATFFLPHLSAAQTAEPVAAAGDDSSGVVMVTKGEAPIKRLRYTHDDETSSEAPPTTGGTRPPPTEPPTNPQNRQMGSALGPDWHTCFKMRGRESYRHVHVEYTCEVASVLSPEELRTRGLEVANFPSSDTPPGRSPDASPTDSWPVYVELSNGKVYGCDLIVSATGVVPNTSVFRSLDPEMQLRLADDGGIAVDTEMRTSVADVYAAGDVCTVEWDPQSKLWFQMRLWTQARQMGAYAAKCMAAHHASEPITQDFCFELFSHVTQFFGYKVVLLGRYNAQGLGSDYEVLLRYTKGMEYIKLIVKDGRIQGAILIGDTELEETFENLILNGMDVSRFGESLLDPDIDIEDYFD